MSIRRYVANKDTTITNAYKSNLVNRATDANMGASDILEIFSIYGQTSTSSLEASRVLVQFPIEDIVSDRNLKRIGQSGNVEFILKLSNAVHGESTPSNISLVVSALSKSWDEGHGLDMEQYNDLGKANWISASSTSAWNTPGGDVLPINFTKNLPLGTEDLEVNITSLVESWITDSVINNGILVSLTSSQENADQSYYTKRFFARGSEFFYKRPWIEARTSDFFKDNRGNFILSSSLLDVENLNTLVLYNSVNGVFKNIPAVGTGSDMYVSVYAGTTSPTGYALELQGGNTKIQAGFYKTGVYTASLSVYTTASVQYLFDIWFSGSTVESTSSVIFATNVIYPNNHGAFFTGEKPEYVVAIQNLKNVYTNAEKANFRLFARDKYWQPNTYLVASYEAEPVIIENLYYKITRVQDNYEVIPYGTGSKQHTKVSYDVDGNYFNLDMDLFEKDYSYMIHFGHTYGDDFYELKEKFKFRVE